MKSSDAVALTAILIVVILILAWYAHGRTGRDRYCPRSGPHNIGLHDRPYAGYPSYEGRGALSWDGDQRCAAFCQQSPCSIWCR